MNEIWDFELKKNGLKKKLKINVWKKKENTTKTWKVWLNLKTKKLKFIIDIIMPSLEFKIVFN